MLGLKFYEGQSVTTTCRCGREHVVKVYRIKPADDTRARVSLAFDDPPHDFTFTRTELLGRGSPDGLSRR